MKTPYFYTNKNEFFKIIAPKLAEFGYNIRYNNSNDYNLIVLNDTDKFGIVSNYTGLENIDRKIDRYLETNIHQFFKTAAQLMGKEYKSFLGEKDVIWCPTEKLANQVLEIADKLGYKWSTEKSFIGYSNWDSYKEETCYFISEGKFAFRSFYQRHNHNIIPAEEFVRFYKKYLNMEEKRNIAISLNEAKEWYKSGNATLKELALKAYSKKELEYVNFNQIYSEVQLTTPKYYVVPDCEDRKWSVIHKLSTIAQYFNSKSPVPTTQWFIKGMYGNELQVGTHSGVRYPGVVYFNMREDLEKAIELIGEDIKYLF